MEKIKSNTTNSWENLTQYYLLTCRIVVNLIVWEKGRGKEAAGQSRAPRRVMWMKCLPCDTFQPMEAALRPVRKVTPGHNTETRRKSWSWPGGQSINGDMVNQASNGTENRGVIFKWVQLVFNPGVKFA